MTFLICSGLGAGMERSGGFSGEVAGEEGNEPPQPEISNIPHIPEGVDWFCDLNNMNNNGEDNNEVTSLESSFAQ